MFSFPALLSFEGIFQSSHQVLGLDISLPEELQEGHVPRSGYFKMPAPRFLVITLQSLAAPWLEKIRHMNLRSILAYLEYARRIVKYIMFEAKHYNTQLQVLFFSQNFFGVYGLFWIWMSHPRTPGERWRLKQF